MGGGAAGARSGGVGMVGGCGTASLAEARPARQSPWQATADLAKKSLDNEPLRAMVLGAAPRVRHAPGAGDAGATEGRSARHRPRARGGGRLGPEPRPLRA